MKRIAFALLGVLVATSAYAGGPSCRRPGGFGGGDAPTPFLDSNQRVELADGELYTLIGRIRFVEGRPYLEVDLTSHAWLANPRRKANSLYPLQALPDYWRRFEGLKLKNFVEAHETIELSEPYGDGRVEAQHVIGLQPLADPVRLE